MKQNKQSKKGRTKAETIKAVSLSSLFFFFFLFFISITSALGDDAGNSIDFSYPDSINYSTISTNYSEYANCWSTAEGVKCDVADITYDEISGGDVNADGYTGFFDYLGEIANRILELWVTNINADGNITVGGTGSYFNRTLLIDGDIGDELADATLVINSGNNLYSCINLTEGDGHLGFQICNDGSGSNRLVFSNAYDGYEWFWIDRDDGTINFLNQTEVHANMTAEYFIGDGSGLTNLNTTLLNLSLNGSFLAIDGSNANQQVNLGNYGLTSENININPASGNIFSFEKSLGAYGNVPMWGGSILGGTFHTTIFDDLIWTIENSTTPNCVSGICGTGMLMSSDDASKITVLLYNSTFNKTTISEISNSLNNSLEIGFKNVTFDDPDSNSYLTINKKVIGGVNVMTFNGMTSGAGGYPVWATDGGIFLAGNSSQSLNNIPYPLLFFADNSDGTNFAYIAYNATSKKLVFNGNQFDGMTFEKDIQLNGKGVYGNEFSDTQDFYGEVSTMHTNDGGAVNGFNFRNLGDSINTAVSFLQRLGTGSTIGDFKIETTLIDNTAGAEDVKTEFQIETDGSLNTIIKLEEDDVNVTGNIYATGVICDSNGCIGSGSGNPFDQSLNTTDNVTFNNLTVTGAMGGTGTQCVFTFDTEGMVATC